MFGSVTTGASDDLRKVHEISRSMITQYGMGTELASKQLPADDYSMSDHTRRMVDEEQQYLTDLAHRRAAKLVAENRTLLEALAFTLLENEVLEREDIETARRARTAAEPGRAGQRRRRSRGDRPGIDRRPKVARNGTRSYTPRRVFGRIDHIGVPSVISTRPWPSTRSGWACPWSTARPSRSRAWRPCCSMWA